MSVTQITSHEDLVVIDKIEVGPIKLEKQRVTTEYRIFQGDKITSTELIYRFENDVFDPTDSQSQNLAAMMTAQVALNYGLFCREIVFHGIFDQLDRRFLRNFVENTSREILVMKLLQPNPFIRGVELEPELRKSYCNAKLTFPEMRGTNNLSWDPWKVDRSHVVLSSGGKDSLLSYGLLREMNSNPHAVFVNESGRHWFTALNAYRGLKHLDTTHRVWCNSDRVFNWMLRQLPFVREDFADVRADIYPIRLWTVAVFLFGALPVMKKHKLGRLVIGDEYDTSETLSYHGIKHYGGLYDQSRFFDHELSRYFMAKGWGIRQFSVLRPCSEMLIEVILAKRYPDLLAWQTSCHATHQEDEKIIPCGRCEKCRRIVGMLSSIDVDPALCGYDRETVEACLKALVAGGLKQEEEGASHLLFQLTEKGLMPKDAIPPAQRKAYPEVMHLRFDKHRSPWTDVPGDIRRPLYQQMLEHALGCMVRQGKTWKTVDLFKQDTLDDPYAFEHDAPSHDDSRKDGHLWGEMTWPEAEERLKVTDLAILPVGAIEQHGPHLPLDIDAYDAGYLAERVAAACSDPKPLVLPLLSYGVSYHHDDFAGTISVSHEALVQMVTDIGLSLAHNGIKKLVIINGHGGNDPALHYAAQKINSQTRMFVCVDSGETSDVDVFALVETPNDVHAGEFETSTALATRPHLVRKDKIRPHEPCFTNKYLDFSSQRGVTWFSHTKTLSENGVMGDPSKATEEKGRRMWEIMIAHLVAMIEQLKSISLEEIYQKRY